LPPPKLAGPLYKRYDVTHSPGGGGSVCWWALDFKSFQSLTPVLFILSLTVLMCVMQGRETIGDGRGRDPCGFGQNMWSGLRFSPWGDGGLRGLDPLCIRRHPHHWGPGSLATTAGISFDCFSSRYWDVSLGGRCDGPVGGHHPRGWVSRQETGASANACVHPVVVHVRLSAPSCRYPSEGHRVATVVGGAILCLGVLGGGPPWGAPGRNSPGGSPPRTLLQLKSNRQPPSSSCGNDLAQGWCRWAAGNRRWPLGGGPAFRP